MAMATLPLHSPAPGQPFISDTPLQLVQVHVLFRHGDRSPIPLHGGARDDIVKLWESRLEQAPVLMPQQDYHFQEHPFGKLTNRGAEQAREFGHWLRRRYVDSGWSCIQSPTSSIQARSSNYSRTHLTCWLVLEALLGTSSAAATVPILIREEEKENLLHNDEQCPRLATLWRSAWNRATNPTECLDGTLQETNWHTRFENEKIVLSTYLGLKLDEITKLSWLPALDRAQCGIFHGDPLPDGVSEEQLREMIQLLAQDYLGTFCDKVICQLSMGRLMNEIMNSLLQCANQSSLENPAILLYSGHDATIMPLSVCFGVLWSGWASYLSSITIELWRKPDAAGFYVRVLYDGKEVPLPMSLTTLEDAWKSEHQSALIKKSLCTLEEFYSLARLSMLSEEEFFEHCYDNSSL